MRAGGRSAPVPVIVPGTRREREAYGDGARQFGQWWLPPAAPEGELATVVLLHGGYWRPDYDLSLENAVAADLAAHGFLVWNVDYRSSADPWPATLTDVAAAYDHLQTGRFAARVDPGRIAVVGHSAGGHLALWLAGRRNLPDGAPGAGPRSTAPALVVAQAPVAALTEAARLGLGGGAVQALLGGEPGEQADRYATADPIALLPTAVRTVLVHAPDDDIVPISQSESYASAARDAHLVQVAGGHFGHLDPTSPAGAALREALESL